ncbi:S-adenosyl-L-methionine-dependent methyltransferase [Roridomyces roridus]|uniref:S-adenosyl-L-methionine-dependent methyltransferase n=1 Tax=Roridomyces roridus TaxID=1738132 RepID=A0AAD7FYQ8_9AGAR|nr:S-adenosyl-L-methionine-dependent methyltransferase [Roridomyces roridus]
MLSDALLEIGYRWIDRGLIPDFVLRRVIRALLRKRLREIDYGSVEANHASTMKWIEDARGRERIAELTQKANEQHYEVSTDFWLSVLGPRAKYSACLYPTGKETLAEAELLMLESYCVKADLRDGQTILDLGCGWGTVTLFLAERYPNSRIVGLSNSSNQRAYIDEVASVGGLDNVEIITADVNTFDFEGTIYFDRIITVGMFEHMKNYESLFAKVARWLRPRVEGVDSDDSLLFIDVFCHAKMPYHFEDADGWMTHNFFSGGTMPSHDLFVYFQSDLTLVRSWFLPGTNYACTLRDWPKRLDAAEAVRNELQRVQNDGMQSEGNIMFQRWRVYLIACFEMFNMDSGEQWGTGHYLFKRG